METVFKKGDKVFHICYGWGEVIEVNADEIYGLVVNFHNKDEKGGEMEDLFTLDGKEYLQDLRSILSFTEYTIQGFSQERPIVLPEVGELCLFSDGENRTWILKEFICYKPEETLPYITKGDVPYKLMKRIKILD
jgi:hypothetical protein